MKRVEEGWPIWTKLVARVLAVVEQAMRKGMAAVLFAVVAGGYHRCSSC